MISFDPLWQQKTWKNVLLYPFMWIFQIIIFVRRRVLIYFTRFTAPVPILVVGNLTTGGVGKTPLVIALANYFSAKGIRVGIVSRGYKAKRTAFPHEVSPEDSAADVGDEPFLIALKTQVPVVISPKRMAAVHYLLQQHAVQVIISDDGLQHYRMRRSIEIVVIDGMRGLGNQLCLPAGPLREPVSRLKNIDFLIVNSGTWPNAYAMHLMPESLISLKTNQKIQADKLKGPIAAIAGIGHPTRFFKTLESLSIVFKPYIFPDHYAFKWNDFTSISQPTIIMTEKDAVKCYAFATDKMYYLPVQAKVEHSFWDSLWEHPSLKSLR